MSKKRGNGEGSIYYSEKLKRWVGQFTAGYKENGTINRKTVYGKTRKEVAEKVIAKQNEVNSNMFIDKSEIVFSNLAKNIIEEQFNSNTISPSSYNRKKETLKQISKTKIYEMKIQEIKINDINVSLNELNYYSNSVISKIYGLINQTLNKAVLYNIISNNPFNIKGAIIMPKSQKETKKIEAFTIEEQKLFLLELDKSNDKYKDIFIIALYSGMRIGEILALKKEDIDFKNNIIHIKRTLTKNINDKYIIGSKTKTYNGIRDIPIFPQLKNILQKYCFRDILFMEDNKIINPNIINTHFKKICKNTNINILHTKKKKGNNYVNLLTSSCNTHMLRHTFATRCIEAGMSAVVLQRLLGHKDIETTLNTYTSVFNKFKEDEVLKVVNYFNTL